MEESQEIEEPNPKGTTVDSKITYTEGFNGSVSSKNIETAKKILMENVESGFVIAFQAGTYVNSDNVENVKRALKYFVDNNYKIIITTERVKEISDDK